MEDFTSEQWREMKQRATEEARGIYESESTRRNRTFEEVTVQCYRGHAAEMFLINHYWFSDDTRKFKDLYMPDGRECDVKVTAYDKKYIIRDCVKHKLTPWRKFPDTIIIFHNHPGSDDYKFIGEFVWDGKTYVHA